MGEFVKKSGVPSKKAKNRDSETEKLLPIGKCAGSDEGSGGAFNGVFEKHGGFEIGLFVDYVVDGLVLHPF